MNCHINSSGKKLIKLVRHAQLSRARTLEITALNQENFDTKNGCNITVYYSQGDPFFF